MPGALVLPTIWQIADRLATQRQRRYLSLVRAELIATVAAAILSQGSAFFTDQVFRFEAASAACLALAIGMQLLSRRTRWSHAWYADRAVAEASLSASWRFMLRTPPFDREPTDGEHFARVLRRELPRGSAALDARLAQLGEAAFAATEQMQQVRQAAWPERARLYQEQRLLDQRDWYTARARYNASRERWFWVATVGANLLAGVFLLVHLLHPAINLVGVMTTLATALLAWTSTRRFHELAESYGALGAELGRLAERLRQAESEAELNGCAAAAEEVMTHEQWVWVARRVEHHVGPPPLRHA